MITSYTLRCNRCLGLMPQITRDPRCCPFCGAAFSITIMAGTGGMAATGSTFPPVDPKLDAIAENFMRRTAPPERKRSINKIQNPLTRIELVLILLAAFIFGAAVGAVFPLRQETATERLEHRCVKLR